MIASRQVECREAAHAVLSYEGVLEGYSEGVAAVQLASDVQGRDRDAGATSALNIAVGLEFRLEEALLLTPVGCAVSVCL
jgi:hypothetical protein